MLLKTHNTSSNSETGKEYDRTTFVCEADDIWVSVESPKES